MSEIVKETELKTWECKIGEVDWELLPPGSDGPMRKAVAKAYYELTGKEAGFIFSGWGAELSKGERAVYEDSDDIWFEEEETQE